MATPKLALIPTGYKAGKLYSVLPESGVGDFTVVRATEATRVNEAGLIETMGANVPRLDYSDGGCPVLLTEPQSTNLFTNSEDFSTSWSVNNVLVNVNQIISPNGTLNADLVYENTSTNPHFTFQTVGTTTTNDYTISVFAKYSGRFLQVFVGGSDAVGNPYVNFDLQNGTFNNNGANGVSMENYGNGWYRCSVEVTSAVTSGFNPIFGLVKTLNSSRASSYTGDGTSGIYIFGAMLEQGSYPSSYIKSEGSAVTRNGDQVNGSGDAATFNDSEGVLYAEISALANDGTNRQISISNGGTTERIYFGFSSNANEFILSSRDSSYIQSTVSDVTNFNKYAFQYKSGNFKAFVNGFNYTLTADGGLLPTGLNTLNFDDGSGGSDFYGNTSQIQYFDTVLTDSELETLTSWTSFIEMAQAQNYNII